MFFFPLSDDNPTHQKPWLSYAILGLCVLIFGWQLSLGDAQQETIIAFGMVPARLFGFERAYDLPYAIPGWLTIASSMFMHGGFMHLAGNMLYLWIFSDNVEDSIGRTKFIAFYALCGIAAALSQALVDIQSLTPMIGASGAIAGVLGGYLLLHPRANVRCILGFFIFFKVINVPAFLVLGFWIGLQFLNLGQTGSNVAYLAHIGGFISGMALIPFFKKPHIKLFGARQSQTFEISPTRRVSVHIPSIAARRKGPWDE